MIVKVRRVSVLRRMVADGYERLWGGKLLELSAGLGEGLFHDRFGGRVVPLTPRFSKFQPRIT